MRGRAVLGILMYFWVHSGLVATNLKVSLHRNRVVCAPGFPA